MAWNPKITAMLADGSFSTLIGLEITPAMESFVRVDDFILRLYFSHLSL